MSNEIKTLAQEETAETKAPAHLPVLAVEKDEEPAFSENDQEKAWHELKNAYITKRILIGELIGMEVTPNDNRTVGITYYNGQKVIIPAQELIDLGGSTGKGSADVRRQKLLSSMIGAEISYVIIGLDNNTQTVVASRLKANERNRQTFYFDKDDNGYYKIYEGSIVEARIIGIGESSIRAEVFGAECTIHSKELSWDWVTDVSESFSVGERVMVRITEIHGRDEKGEFSIAASVRQAQSNKQAELLKTVTKGNLYTGQIVDIRKGTYLIKLSNGVNALAHSSHCKKPVMRSDIVAFVVNFVDNKTMMATGNIIRIIKPARKY